MTDTTMYEKRLRDVIRPDIRSEREDSTSYTVADYVALAMQNALQEIAAYERDEDKQEIAQAYIEYIDSMVRDEGRDYVTLYSHTHTAEDVLHDAGRMTRGPFEHELENEELFKF